MVRELSRMGAHHASTCSENQDSICHGENDDFCVITLADGVSSCKGAKQGAMIANEAITNLFVKKGAYFMEFEPRQTADFAISHILYELKESAGASTWPVEEFSSTVASILVDKRNGQMLCFNLGDSLILGVGSEECRLLSAPGDHSCGCCVTTTKGAVAAASVTLSNIDSLESVVIFSDGAWRELFEKARLKPEVSRMLRDNEYDALTDYLIDRNCFDDFSFISLDLRQKRRISA